MLYDFNLNIGDTLPVGINNEYGNIVIASIDSVLIRDVYHKRFGLKLAGGNVVYTSIIEGIGSKFGLISDLRLPFEQVYTLHCFSINGKNLYPDSTKICKLSASIND